MPVFRMLHAWLIDKTMDGRVVVIALAVHFTTIFTLWHFGQGVLLLSYLLLTSLVWLAMPALNRLGDAVAMRRLRDHDIAHYQTLLANDPRHVAAMGALADAYVERGQLDDAIAMYQLAVETDPEHTRAEAYKLRQAIALRERRRRGRRPPAPVAAPAATSSDGQRVLQEVPPAETPPPPPPATPEPDDAEEAEARRQEVWQWFDTLEKDEK